MPIVFDAVLACVASALREVFHAVEKRKTLKTPTETFASQGNAGHDGELKTRCAGQQTSVDERVI